MKKAFTLLELLITLVIIAILAAMMLGALNVARNSAREAATKATITKLNNIIMQRYESYFTRRIGFDTTDLTNIKIIDKNKIIRATPQSAAWYRLHAIRDLMRMEMPDALSDIKNPPIIFVTNGESWCIPEPLLHKLYAMNPPTAKLDPAQCLYMIVSMGNPEAMEQFRQNEIGIWNGKPVFVDGWGNPIMWLRWAPGLNSAIQINDTIKHHDPFDTRNVDLSAFHLIPFIYSSGGIKKSDGEPNYGIDTQPGYIFNGNPYANLKLGSPIDGQNIITINNHYMEQR